MTGHAPAPTLKALTDQSAKGITLMLPSEDSLWVSEELTRRFGVSSWQFALTATDANRFAIRLARHLTGRSIILVFNWCYHGTVDETFATLGADGVVRARSGNLGPPVDPALTTRVVEFNDVDALERELARRRRRARPHRAGADQHRDRPSRAGLPRRAPRADSGARHAARDRRDAHDLLRPGGYTQEHGLEPDVVTIGKPIAGGIPAAAYGFSAETAARLAGTIELEDVDVGGVGGTLAANALSSPRCGRLSARC